MSRSRWSGLPVALALWACEGDGRGMTSPAPPRFSVLTSVSVTDLGTLPGGTYSRALDINATGQVTGFAATDGTSFTSYRAFLWTTQNGMQDLGTLPGGTSSLGLALNDFGQVVGYSKTTAADRPIHAFLWTPGVGMQDLGTLAGDESVATGINNAGQVVGWTSTTSGEIHAFVWTAAHGMRDLGTLGGNFSRLNWINDLGQAAGTSRTVPNTFDPHRAMIWSEATGLILLGALNDGSRSEAARINSLGEAVGGSSIDPVSVVPIHPFLWTAERGMIDLGTLGWSGFAEAINDLEQVVGISQEFEGAGLDYTLPFLWTAEGGIVQLPTLGGAAGSAYDITDRGIVVGESRTASGDAHATRWALTLTPPTPVEEVDFIASAVGNAVSAGALPAGPAEGLLGKLDAATRLVGQGNVVGAVSVLEAFVRQLEAMIEAGSILITNGQPIIDAARRAIAELGG